MKETFFNELVNKRLSVRKYIDKPIDDDSIKLCLEAARLAPSACNSQPWRFVVVNDKTKKDELCDKAFSGIYSINSFAKGAPVIIAVVSEKSTFLARIGGQFRGTQYLLIDIGISCEHLVLQAAELGIGSCFLGWFNERAVKKALNIPGHKKVDLLISLGYYEGIDRPKSRNALNDIYSYNKYRWSQR